MARRIQLRRDTATNWETVDPVLAAGEVGVDLTSMKIKVGNGIDSWAELNYVEGDSSVDLTDYALKTELPDVSNFITASDIPVIPGDISDLTDTSNLLTASINLAEGKTLFVSTLGDDNNTGESIDRAVETVSAALAKATAGDIIKISAGTYIEEFPLTVPKGVTVRGASLRATTIRPTELTKDKDCFLLEGETTVEEMSIKGMFYNNSDNTGYAFRFKANAEIATRSPYIQRVTVLNRGSTTTTADPYGFLSADAGRGAFLDGADVTRNSVEAAMLFNECTFIVPNSRALIMTNGARSEWLNCFTYFADLAIEGVSGETGRGGEGKTYLTISNRNGDFLVGDTITVRDEFDDVVETAVITAVSGDTFTLEGKKTGFSTLTASRPSKTASIIQHGAVVIDTNTVQFGTGSLSTASGGFLSIINDQDLAFGTGDFTVEFWVNRDFVFGTQVYFDMRTSTNPDAPHLYSEGSNLIYFINPSTIVNLFGILSSTNQWYHIAVSRLDGSTTIYVNGNSQGAITDTTDYTSTSIFIGASFDGGSTLSGYVDEFRITKGISRYDNSFQEITEPFVNDSDTVLLLHFDGAIEDDAGISLNVSSSSGGTATFIDRVNLLEFGAELRSIAGANVYGNQGVKAEGDGVKLHLISHNFAYIGTGADLTNDSSKVVQQNEVIEIGAGEVFYSSIDQDGNYRIGDLFTVNYETGNVTFSASDFDITGITGLTLDDGVNVTKLSSTGIETGNLILAGNTVSTKTGNIVLDPGGSGEILLNANVTVTGQLNGIGIRIVDAPTTSAGAEGDTAGDIAVDTNYFYYCMEDYTDTGANPQPSIWKRVEWNTDTW